MTILTELSNVSLTGSVNPSHWYRRRMETGLAIERMALKLFLDKGPEQVSIEEIALAAGMSRRSFFRYFRTKDEILAAMPTRQMLVSSVAVCNRPEKESIVEAILATTRNIQFSDQEQEIIHLSQTVMFRYPDAWARAVGDLRRAMDKIYEGMIAHRLQGHECDDFTIGVVAAGLAAIVVYTYTNWVNNGCNGDFANLLEGGLKSFSVAGLVSSR